MNLTPRLNPAVRYSQSDFVPIVSLAVTPPLLVVTSDFPANDVKGLLELARAKPGSLSYGTWGQGSLPHVAGEWLDKLAGTRMTPIPYKGEVPVLQDMLGGQIKLGWVTMPALQPHLQSGKLKVLAIASAQRDPLMPSVPTFVEQGVRDFVITSWTGLFAAKGTPPEIVRQLNDKVREVLRQPEVQERFRGLGLTLVSLSPEQFGSLVAADAARLAPTLDQLATTLKP